MLLLPLRSWFWQALALCAVGCTVRKGLQRVAFTRRRHLVLLPAPLERLLGEYCFQSMLGERTGKGGAGLASRMLPAKHKDTELVVKIGERLVAVLGSLGAIGVQGHHAHLRSNKWAFLVVKDPIANAFALPGGKIVVHTGLLDLCARNEDEVAVVVAHELGHVLARHSVERIGVQVLLVLGVNLAAAAVCKAMQFMRHREMSKFNMDLVLYDSRGEAQYRWDHKQQTLELVVQAKTRSLASLLGQTPKQYPPHGSVVIAGSVEVGMVLCETKGGRTGTVVSPVLLPINTALKRYSPQTNREDNRAPQTFHLSERDLRLLALHGFCEERDASTSDSTQGTSRTINYSEERENQLVGKALSKSAKLLVELPFSRQHETEADLIGLKLMGLAGFALEKAPIVFEKLGAGKKGGLGAWAFLSTHPSDDVRVETLRRELAAMQASRLEPREACTKVLVNIPYWLLK